MTITRRWRGGLVAGVAVLGVAALTAQTPVPRAPVDLRTMLDPFAPAVLRMTGVPSASIAVVSGGTVAFVQAYGDARLEPRLAAAPAMRYSIGSISKQFTAAA